MQVALLEQATTDRQEVKLETKEEREMTDSNSREFLCDDCNQFRFQAIQPDDMHTVFLTERCCDKSIEQFFDCENCNKRTHRYWCIKHVSARVIVSKGYNLEEGLSSRYTDPF